MALTADRNTSHSDGEFISAPVGAAVICFAGGIACSNAAGFVVPGEASLTLTYLGRFDETIDNTLGADGAVNVIVRRKGAFKWKNSTVDPVQQNSLGKLCYVVDDETVAATDWEGTYSAAGIVIQLDIDGVWVE